MFLIQSLTEGIRLSKMILMDIMMPVMNGYEAAGIICEINRPDAVKVPIIAMTANAFTEDRIATKKTEMNEHLAKPLDIKLVIQTICRNVSVCNAVEE